MKIGITGASGFIGAAMVYHFSKNRLNKIVAFGRSPCDKFKQLDNVQYVQIDLTEICSDLDIDYCIHCSGLADDRSTAEEYYLNNVYATQLLMKHIPLCKTFIYISSSSVYGFNDSQPKMERDAILHENLSAYGRSNLLAKDAVLNANVASTYILRPRLFME